MKLFKLNREKRERVRGAIIRGVNDYEQKKKPATKAKRWGGLATIFISALIFIQTGNLQFASMGGELAGSAVEQVIDARSENVSAE